jgi:hypothetical protein
MLPVQSAYNISALAGFTFVVGMCLHAVLLMLVMGVACWRTVWVEAGPHLVLRAFWGTPALMWGSIRKGNCWPCFVVVLFRVSNVEWRGENSILSDVSAQHERWKQQTRPWLQVLKIICVTVLCFYQGTVIKLVSIWFSVHKFTRKQLIHFSFHMDFTRMFTRKHSI